MLPTFQFWYISLKLFGTMFCLIRDKNGRSMEYLQSFECSGWRRVLTSEPILPRREDVGTNTDRQRSSQKTSTIEEVKVLVDLAAFLTKMNTSVVRYTTSMLDFSSG